MQPGFWKQFEGQVIEGGYRLSEFRGCGGFGGVFLAEQFIENTFARIVAVKGLTGGKLR
jgi:hypothetical protein